MNSDLLANCQRRIAKRAPVFLEICAGDLQLAHDLFEHHYIALVF